MSKGRSVRNSGARGSLTRARAEPGRGARGRRPKRERLLPRIGGTREEVQRTLVETMEGILSGRLEPKEAFAIGRLCNLQLKLLGLMEQVEHRIEREKEAKRGKVKKQWVN